jgi:hypothetical protein
MEKFRRSIEHLQKQEGVRTIKHAHMLGFLDPGLPKRSGRPSGHGDMRVEPFVSNVNRNN